MNNPSLRAGLAAGFLALGLLAGCASYETRSAAPAHMESGGLVGANGMTLYTFDKDAAGSGHHARRRQEAMGPPRQAALLLDQGPETRRQERGRRQ